MSATSTRIAAALDPFLQGSVPQVFPAAAVQVMQNGETLYERAVGWLDPDRRLNPASLETLFDLASLTKLFTATAFLRLVAEGRVRLDDPAASILTAFQGERPIQPYEDPLQPGQYITLDPRGGFVQAGEVTFRQLLSHSSGLPAWRPFYRLPQNEIEAALLGTFFSYKSGEKVLYSDLGYLLLGLVIRDITAQPLDLAMGRLVFDRLFFEDSGKPPIQYGPLAAGRSAPTEDCRWRGRRIHGEVHDENAWAMGGVAGHAGMFGSAAALARFGQAWLNSLEEKDPLLPSGLAQEATRLQAEDGANRRGLGWGVWSADPESPGYPFSRRSFGHTGFTGTSLFLDPQRALVVACLTNEVYHGRSQRKIGGFRLALHGLVVEAV